MKKSILLIFTFIGLQVVVYGHEHGEYHPILEKGKVWILDKQMGPTSQYPSHKTKVWVDSDTVINDKCAHKVLMEDIGLGKAIRSTYLLEENKQLFFFSSSRWQPLLDFSACEGEETLPFYYSNPLTVDEESSIRLFDKSFRCLKVTLNMKVGATIRSASHIWIEGIGAPDMFFLYAFPIPTCNGDDIPVTTFEACYLNDELLYTNEEYNKVSGIKRIESERTSTDVIYDLHGRKVTSLLPGSIYICNGKKFVGK